MKISASDGKDIAHEFIRVVVADDSPFICRLLTSYLESDPAIRVVKTVHNGKQAMEVVKEIKPDVLTLDLNMPVLSGLDALKQIMTKSPTAVVLISGVSKEAARMTHQGLSLGAVDFIFKYTVGESIPPESIRREIIAKVKAAARIKVIRSIPSIDARVGDMRSAGFKEISVLPRMVMSHPDVNRNISRLVVIGASTGGPLAIKELLSSLTKGFSFPIVIVQHMPEGFTAIMAAQLDRLFPFSVREAIQDEYLPAGTVLVVPGDRHLVIAPNGKVQLSMAPAVNGHRPSIDVTMQSAAQMYGRHTTGILLSGMGDDGTQGLLAIRNNCGSTFAQSRETCVVDTMPYSAIEKGSVERVGSPTEIGYWLSERLEAAVEKI